MREGNCESQGSTVVSDESAVPSTGEPPAVASATASTPRPVRWLARPAQHDYAAATSYLSLNVDKKTVAKVIEKLAHTKPARFKAKDILRATNLPLLPRDNIDVAKQLERIAAGEKLSPCLLVRGRLEKGWIAQIADGYHRVCAANYVDEDADVPVQIISL